jgi:hypothetical protein
MTAFNLIKSLTRRGNVVLGSGCYAAAIGSTDSSQIIKIGNSMNDPWLDYYHGIIKANQANPHVPKVKYFMCDEDHNYYICIMERLEEEANVNKTDIAELCKDYTTHMITREEFVESALAYPTAIPCADTLANLLDKIYEDTEVFGYDDLSDSDTTNYSRKLDMHRGNFMFRDGVVIVTDPWCEVDMQDIVDVSDWVDRMSQKTTSKSW